MASGHPVDALGRVQPDPAWPPDKAAPAPWDVIRRFCNTSNRESGADRFESLEGLHRWRTSEGFVDGASRATSTDCARIVEFREHVRAHALAHHHRVVDTDLDAALADHVADLKLVALVRNGRLQVVPAGVGVVNQMIGIVAMAIMGAQHDGVWKRFKACSNCEWVFYDRSKNESGRWCSMNACGGRAKMAAFREREKDSTR